MDQQGIPVNVTIFNALIAACVRTKFLMEGKIIHTHIRMNGLENNGFLRTKLMHMYTSCGFFEDADKVFDESSSESVYPWNALLRGAVIAGGKAIWNLYNDPSIDFSGKEYSESMENVTEYTETCLSGGGRA